MSLYEMLPRREQKVGQAPGTLAYVGPAKDFAPKAEWVAYGPEGMDTEPMASASARPDVGDGSKHWLRVRGVHDVDMIRALGESFGLHPLLQEDILNVGQRPKVERFGNALFLVAAITDYREDEDVLVQEQVSVVWMDDVVLTFQEGEEDVFEPVMARLRKPGGRIRKSGDDYLVVALLDVVVDRSFSTLARMGRVLEELETSVLARQAEDDLLAIHHLKREVMALRGGVWPLRAVLSELEKLGPRDLTEEAAPYLRDVRDHAMQAADAVAAMDALLDSLQGTVVSLAGLRMNQVMKVLTVIATIFIPLTFIAGVYGMNFRFMPELEHPWAYPLIWLVMLAVAVGMILYFKRKRWF